MSKCLNPSCGKKFTPGHYGSRQRVCGGTYLEKCSRCPGKTCRRCGGRKRYRKSCSAWYKGHQIATSQPPRGLGDAWARVAKRLDELSPEMATLIRVARETGLRKGELLGLTRADVVGSDGIRKSIEVTGTWKDGEGFKRPKTAASRRAYLTPAARLAIREAIRLNPKAKADERIWSIGESAAWRLWTDFQKKIRVQNPETGQPFRFHDLRHTVGSELVLAGKIKVAQQMLGHKNIATTMRYGEQTVRQVLDEVAAVRGNG